MPELFSARVALLLPAPAAMESSKLLCIEDAEKCFASGRIEAAFARLEKAASYAWGFFRPVCW